MKLFFVDTLGTRFYSITLRCIILFLGEYADPSGLRYSFLTIIITLVYGVDYPDSSYIDDYDCE